ncbi:Replicative DNA helicase (DnaB) [hydrothermal vent metagenome]|uniref:DNA 5'-3' helicase n=1 Tax=hydrothermal vent metagenome TaxID=652676 RepID=A0A3B1D1A1_9ZZZZ
MTDRPPRTIGSEALIPSRVPPHNMDMEQAILGAILLDNEALPKALEALTGSVDFYKPAHRKIYEGILDLYERNEPVDLMTLAEALRKKGWIEQVGGVDYLAELLDIVPTSANIKIHCKTVRENAVLRKLISVAGETVTMAYEHDDDVDKLVDNIESMILNISQERARGSFIQVKNILKSTMKTVEDLYDNKSLITGVASGYKDLDEKTTGFQKSDLVIVAGRPSMGKTAFAFNVIQNFTKINEEGVVCVFSLEMSSEQLVIRMLCSEARVSSQKLRTGYLAQSDWPKLTTAAGNLYKRSIFIDDTPSQTILDMRGKARRLQAEKGRLDLVVIDYLQLMDSRGRVESRVQEVSGITRSLKQLAKELNVPVIAISQLSRKVEDRVGSKRPQLSDLRESGSIEQDADVVLFVYRDEFYNPDKVESQGVAEIIIGKQRNGPLGNVKLTFLKEFTRFEDYTRQEGGYSDSYEEF